MKKRISAMLMAMLMTLVLCVPALAADGTMNYVIDVDNLMTYGEWELLEDQAAEISQRHGCGVYVLFMADYTYYDCGSVYETAETLYHSDGFGEGSGLDGILLLVSMSARDYALYVYGERAENVFDADAIAALEDDFLPVFAEDDWIGGFRDYLAACDEGLNRAEADVPTQTPADEPTSPVRGIVTVAGISCLVALLVCLMLKGKMKSVHRKSEARSYTASGGLQLTEKYDRYTHTTESVRRIERKSSGGSSGSSGGSGSSGKL